MLVKKEDLVEFYWNRGLPRSKVAQELGLTSHQVRYYMEKYGISFRPSGSDGKPFPRKYFFTKEELEKLYHEEGLTLYAVSERLAVPNIKYWFVKYGIPRRKAAALNPANKIKPNLEKSEALYYFLGFFYGDGSVYKHRVIISTGLKENLANRVSLALGELGLHPKIRFRDNCKYNANWKGYWYVQAHSKELAEWLTKLEFENLLLGNDLANAFISGLFDAEGYVDFKGRLHIANTNEKLVLFGKRLLEQLGYHPTLWCRQYHDRKWQPLWRLGLQRKAEVVSFLSNRYIPSLHQEV